MMVNWQLSYWKNSKLHLPATGTKRIYVNAIFGRERYIVSLLWEKCLMLKHFLKLRLQWNIRGSIINDNLLSWLNEKNNSKPISNLQGKKIKSCPRFFLSTSAEMLTAKRIGPCVLPFLKLKEFPNLPVLSPHQWMRRLIKILRLDYNAFDILKTRTLTPKRISE